MSKHPYLTAPDPKEKGWPGGVPYIIGNEGCERFSYYGMNAILYIYVASLYVNLLGLGDSAAASEATHTVHLFKSAVYAFPMIGAVIADRFLGKYHTIMYLSCVYCLGHVVLAASEGTIWGLYLGLALIGIGSGGIKPCVSAHVGDQFGSGNWHLVQKVYNLFYFIINFGSAFATIIIPAVRGSEKVNPETGMHYFTGNVSLAFAIPGILMGLATIFFWMGRHKFVHVPPTHPGKRGFLDALAGCMLFLIVGWPIWGGDIISHSLHKAYEQPIGEKATSLSGELAKNLDEVRDLTNDKRYSAAVPDLDKLVKTTANADALEHSDVAPTLAAAEKSLGLAVRKTKGDPPKKWEEVKKTLGKLANNMPSKETHPYCWPIVGVLSFISLGAFVLVFGARQKIEQDDGFLAIMFYSLFNRSSTVDHPQDGLAWSNHWFFGPASKKFGGKAIAGPVAVLKIMSIFIFISVFWSLFDQHSTTWIGQAKEMNRTVGDFSMVSWLLCSAPLGAIVGLAVGLSLSEEKSARITATVIGLSCGGILGALMPTLLSAAGVSDDFVLQPDQIPATNPFMVMVLIPLTAFGFYPFLKKLGLNPSPLVRMTIGMFLAAFSFVAVALIQRVVQGQSGLPQTERLHVFWQLIPYLIITSSEVMVSITGLEFAYTQAPKRMKSVIMGFWLFCVTLGNVIVAQIARIQSKLERARGEPIPLETFFWVFAALMMAAALAFALRARFYQYQDYTQDGE